MEEKDLIEQSIEKRKVEIQDFKQQQELLFESMTEDEKIEYLVNTYTNNSKLINKYGFSTISEDEVKWKIIFII